MEKSFEIWMPLVAGAGLDLFIIVLRRFTNINIFNNKQVSK
jgi:hypothetical protein